ncbi:CDP-alcohol phosphatidyltransferase family protein [Methyloligella solikamskensis]|uniref:Phosphatidylcholine synthase n=1 Tax=Methyloligella solikamskensis TaxID=1177756 RepID=A0ABW3JAX8_9HYPH
MRAAAVHVLTATGACLALLAILAAADGNWQLMFAWLGLALFVDGIDGPLARRYGTKEHLARWSGDDLDNIVDYLTYAFVPAFALAMSDLLPGGTALIAGFAILLSSLFHFSDSKSKTKSNEFVGFPAVWNVVALFLFAFGLPPWANLTIVLILAVLTFVPTPYVHPVRSERLRLISIAVTLLWLVAAAASLLHDFPSPLWIKILLLGTGLYFAIAGFFTARAAND